MFTPLAPLSPSQHCFQIILSPKRVSSGNGVEYLGHGNVLLCLVELFHVEKLLKFQRFSEVRTRCTYDHNKGYVALFILAQITPIVCQKVPTTQLAKMIIDPTFVELTADVLEIFFVK